MLPQPSSDKITHYFSTYGLLIPLSICSKLKMKVDPKAFMTAMEDETSVYHQMCLAPLELMRNGIVLAQIKSYQVFIQKLIIDCYVKDAPTISEVEASGKEPPENARINQMKEEFLQHIETSKVLEQAHYNLIADSYGTLRRIVESNKGTLTSCPPKLKSSIDDFIDQGKCMETQLIGERFKWRERAIEVSDFMMKMGSGRIDDLQELEHRAELNFLQNFGESN